MKGLFSYCFIFVFIIKINAQVNLVPNPSFEIFTTCPNSGSQISYATPWQGVTTNSTDYYNSCASMASTVSIPSDGGGGFQYSRTGVAYAGLYAINGFGGDYREYLQVKLDSTLELDSCYYVEFYCNLHNQSYFAINKMGAYLSNTAVNTVGPSTWGGVLQYTPQITSHTFLTDTLNWMKVAGYYQAVGGEQYLTIGNFDLDDPADTMQTGYGFAYPYYLIDDVTVKKVVGCDTTLGVHEVSKAEPTFNLYPNPNNGTMLLDYELTSNEKGILMIYDISGKLISTYQLENANNQLSINNDQLNNGIYIYKIIVNDRIVKSDKLVIIK